MTDYIVKVLPHGRKLEVVKGTNLFSNLAEHGLFLRSDCGGKGVCGQCKVRLIGEDKSVRETAACQVTVDRDMLVEIPPTSLQSPYVVKKSPTLLPPSFLESCKNSEEIPPAYGVAVDLGTTTIALYLCNINAGRILSSLALKNPQAIHGDDVMSRISGAAVGEESLRRLQKLAIKVIEWGCGVLAAQFSLSLGDIDKMTVVGNPAMIHLFLGVSPATLGVAPYRPAFFTDQQVEAKKLGFAEMDAHIQTLPQVSGFLGGDILAAALAAELDQSPPGTLLIDIGTNGELFYRGEQGLYATSCATGPVFEGAAISCGMQALPGAIDSISIIDRLQMPQFTVIGAKANNQNFPVGICGSGVISGVAELYRAGIVDGTGAFVSENRPPPLEKSTAGGSRYVIARQGYQDGDREVVLKQRDIRAVQLGKAALTTGIEFLLRRENNTRPKRILLAGAFGSFLKKEDIKDLGMIPRIVDEQIEVGGNLAGAGAVMVLCQQDYLGAAREIAEKVLVVELATSPDFQERFVANLHFPNLPG